jgi:tetratricopeptide (TPR) repeat protein
MAMNGPGKESLRTTKLSCVYVPLLLGCLLLLGGCSWMVRISQNMHLQGYDADINNWTRAIETAHNDAERAKGYSKRGSAYSEKARYSRAFKLIPPDDYERMFALAMKDHNQATALNPGSAEAYFSRGRAYYDHASSDLTEHKDFKPWFDHAAADFETASAKDPKNFMAFDMLGLTYEQNDEWDKALDAYTRELALNPKLGTDRLAEAYCGRGQQDQTRMNMSAAAADYEKSIELGARSDDGCSCEPYNSLLVIYTDAKQYDKAWNLVHQEQKSNRLAPELVDQLKKASGRSN